MPPQRNFVYFDTKMVKSMHGHEIYRKKNENKRKSVTSNSSLWCPKMSKIHRLLKNMLINNCFWILPASPITSNINPYRRIDVQTEPNIRSRINSGEKLFPWLFSLRWSLVVQELFNTQWVLVLGINNQGWLAYFKNYKN